MIIAIKTSVPIFCLFAFWLSQTWQQTIHRLKTDAVSEDFYNIFDDNASPADSQDESRDGIYADGSGDNIDNSLHCHWLNYATGKLCSM